MAKPTHIKFLELLEPNGISKGTPIGKFMTDNFEIPANDTEDVNSDNDPAYHFILRMFSKGLISYEQEKFNWIFKWPEWSQGFLWFDTYEVSPSITVDGLDYLDKYRTNELAKKASEASIRGFWATVILSLLTVLITAATLWESRKNSVTLTKIEIRIDTLSARIEQIQSQRSPLQGLLSYPVDQIHKRQTFSLDTLQTTSSKKLKSP